MNASPKASNPTGLRFSDLEGLEEPNPSRIQQELLMIARSRKFSRSSRREAIEFYVYISPWLIGFILFFAFPLIRSFYVSFTDYELGRGISSWIGTKNYQTMFTNPRFWQSFRVTLIFALVNVPLLNMVALGLALILSRQLRGLDFWRTIFFIPSVISSIAIGVMWAYVFRRDSGLFDTLLRLVGIKGPGWLSDERWALVSIIFVSLWTFGSQMVIYLAGIKGIPPSLYEVAEIDGAGAWTKFWNVTIPMLSSTIFFNLVLGVIGALQIFDLPWVMTQGGPNDATRTYMIHLYREGWTNMQMGSASAMGWILFLVIMLITLLIFRTSTVWVYYEGERK
jgi:multiple sugar transport system permease protein